MTDDLTNSIVVCGLPGSGKTTFLAALWHLVQSREIDTLLTLESLAHGDYEYVNAIRKKWQSGFRQIRTAGELRTVGLDLKSASGLQAQLLFPDHSGETFDRIWATRTCPMETAMVLQNRRGIALFLRVETVKKPTPLADMLALEADMIAALPEGVGEAGAPNPQEKKWDPDECPDQVKLVDLLQSLNEGPLSADKEKLAVIVSAWDLVGDCEAPEDFVATRMPLLDQYLRYADHGLDVRFFAISAQGGKYINESEAKDIPDDLTELLNLDSASSRIQVEDGCSTSHDLTRPLHWLIS